MGTIPQDIQARLQVLRDDFAAQLPQRIGAIEHAWLSRTAATPDALHELYRKVHSLAGAAGTFGMSDLSDQARRVEDDLRPLLKGDTAVVEAAATDISAGIARLRRMIETGAVPVLPVEALANRDLAVADKSAGMVYLLEEGDERSTRLQGKLEPFGYRMRTFRDRATLFAAVQRERPLALIMDFHTPEAQAVCTARLAEYQHTHGGDMPVIFISRDSGFDVRLQAVRAGCYAYLEQPVDISVLVERLHDLRADQVSEPYRAMIIEDDAAVAARYALVLGGAGVQVRVLAEPPQVVAALAEFHPDVLLMDLYLPGCNGTELARLIRQNPAYLSMPIVFLSAETDADVQNSVLMTGGDGFITKPIRDERLVAVVRSRAQRARALQDAMARDSLTGLLKHTKIKEQLDLEIARSRRNGTPLSFAMLDIDHFKRVNDTYGHPAGDRVIKGLAQLLRQRLRSTDFIGRYGGEEFAIVLPETDATGASALLDDLREAFMALEFDNGDAVFNVTFSGGVVTAEACQSAGLMTDAADRALYAAKEAGRNRIVNVQL